MVQNILLDVAFLVPFIVGSINPVLYAYAQTALLQKSLQALREDREKRLKDRDSVEAKYRAKAPDLCLSQNEVDLRIEKAREVTQKLKLLQDIHLAHAKAVANNDESRVGMVKDAIKASLESEGGMQRKKKRGRRRAAATAE